MKVYVVIKTSYSPCDEGETTEYQTVDRIFATETAARNYQTNMIHRQISAYSADYDIEEHEVEAE